jgi:hypothetical protein
MPVCWRRSWLSALRLAGLSVRYELGPQMNTIGELKDIYEFARYAGIPGNNIHSFIKVAEMNGYVMVRKKDLPDAAKSEGEKK